MERITDIKELNPGQRIWHINQATGEVEVLEFVCIHPHHEAYSIFLDKNYDAIPKFLNKNIQDGAYFMYDGSVSCWNSIYKAERDWHHVKIQHIKIREDEMRRLLENKTLYAGK